MSARSGQPRTNSKLNVRNDRCQKLGVIRPKLKGNIIRSSGGSLQFCENVPNLPLKYLGNLHIRCDDDIWRRHVTIIRAQQSKKSLRSFSESESRLTKVELRRWETKSTFLHHSLLPITRRGFLRLALITSDIRELITLWRSTLLQEILDFARSIQWFN